ncbi:MAG TPA: phospholipase D-like domain-containing protein [Thermoanaerobaculia bacterium]|nr:phospholipase D-like domain-containing protein [Thermoanaerobaculia bacterium]
MVKAFSLPVLLLLLAAPAAAQQESIELVETFPVETTLDNPDLRDTWQVWTEMIDGARSSLDFAEFYASNEPGSRLEAIIQAVERAADRGVKVRFLGDAKFQKTYPDTLARLGKRKGIEVRTIDFSPLSGGVLHAKYFVADGREVFVGSQNFDFRALEHIQELGVRVAEPAVGRAYTDIFETDWALAGGGDKTFRATPPAGGYGFPARVGDGADAPAVSAVASPKGWLPAESLWDLPQLVKMIDEAKDTVRFQLLTYKTVGYNKEYFDTLESALRRAAARGVKVQMIAANWSQRTGTIEGLQSLQAVPNIDVRLTTIPQWSGGFIPFARVTHAKYLVVDGRHAWVGTSNWERDYFFQSRNLGLVIDSPRIGERLDRYFASTWGSPYAADVDPCAKYPAPRVAE